MNVNDQVLIYGLTAAGEPIPLKVNADGSLAISDGGAGATVDREVVTVIWKAESFIDDRSGKVFTQQMELGPAPQTTSGNSEAETVDYVEISGD